MKPPTVSASPTSVGAEAMTLTRESAVRVAAAASATRSAVHALSSPGERSSCRETSFCTDGDGAGAGAGGGDELSTGAGAVDDTGSG